MLDANSSTPTRSKPSSDSLLISANRRATTHSSASCGSSATHCFHSIDGSATYCYHNYSFLPESLMLCRLRGDHKKDFQFRGFSRREVDVLPHGREMSRGTGWSHSGVRSYWKTSPALRYQFKMRDNDRYYPLIYQSWQSRAKTEIPRHMRLRRFDDDYKSVRRNTYGSYIKHKSRVFQPAASAWS